MTIRTISDLQSALDSNYSWRLQEISNYSSELKVSKNIREKSLVRAGIPLLYAHWEGFIKESSFNYLEFIESQKIELSKLEPCFISLGIRKHINDLIQSKNDQVNVETLNFILNKLNSKAVLKFDSSIKTESNLSSSVFKRIVYTLGIDYLKYSTKEKLIDEQLLTARNKIAHGEYKEIDSSQYFSLKNEIVALLRMFKSDIENNSSLRKYEKSA